LPKQLFFNKGKAPHLQQIGRLQPYKFEKKQHIGCSMSHHTRYKKKKHTEKQDSRLSSNPVSNLPSKVVET
jgi:hypothetical protein